MKGKQQFRIRDASPDRQQKIQSSSVEETIQRIMVQTNNDCRFRIFIWMSDVFWSTWWEFVHNFRRKLCYDQRSGDGWISGWSQICCSLRGIRMPDLEVLEKVASILNKIIHNSQFRRRINLEARKAQEGGPLPSRKTDCLLDLRVLLGHWSQWFCQELCPRIHNCCSERW